MMKIPDNLIPKVLRKIDGIIVEEKFNPVKIIESIVKETNLEKTDARIVTVETTRLLISSNLKTVTAPMIREIACTMMLKLGYGNARYKYTRIGMPIADFENSLADYEARKEGVSLNDLMFDIFLKIKFEYDEVKKVIKKNDIGVKLLVSGHNKKVE